MTHVSEDDFFGDVFGVEVSHADTESHAAAMMRTHLAIVEIGQGGAGRGDRDYDHRNRIRLTATACRGLPYHDMHLATARVGPIPDFYYITCTADPGDAARILSSDPVAGITPQSVKRMSNGSNSLVITGQYPREAWSASDGRVVHQRYTSFGTDPRTLPATGKSRWQKLDGQQQRNKGFVTSSRSKTTMC